MRTRIIAFFASIPIIAFAVVGGYYGRAAAGEEEQTYRHLRVFEDVVSLISNNYVELVDLDDVLEGALRGLAEGLDSDSAYLSPSDARRIESGQQLPEGRVGLDVTRRYYLQVIAARDGSPAAEAGIAPGDYVRAIDGEPTRLLSVIEGERRLHGEPGTTVTLSLIRGSTQEPYDIALVRERLAPTAVSGRLLEQADGVGYLRIPTFDDGVAEAIAEEIAALEADGASHVVIDVRNAAEGAYEAAVQAAGLFVADGTLAIREEHGATSTPLESTTGEDAIGLPVTLLTNFGSSGPAEVFVSALVERERATSIGQRTAGRTSLQRLVALPDGAGLWLSWARYLTAAGESIHPFGLAPGIGVAVQLPELGEPLPEEDAVLERAIEEIEGLVAEAA
ncbi:MAG: S41 family peptidase [Acidobacteria bacterium]|nr:S41 family peptidase [Acidobacteriota bacterium]